MSHEEPSEEDGATEEDELEMSPPQDEKTMEDKETIAIKKPFFMKTPSHFEFVSILQPDTMCVNQRRVRKAEYIEEILAFVLKILFHCG